MKITVSPVFVQNPLVSVVIPSYNRANTVSQTIESILNQECNFDFEIIIGDDCSTDNAREVLLRYQTQYPAKIKLLFYDENIGIGASWATCVKQCRGKYIANCDNDDFWHNLHKLQLQVDFMEEHLQYGLCQTDFRKYNRSTGITTEYKCEFMLKAGETLPQSVIRQHFVLGNASMMYRASVLMKHVNLDDYIKYRFLLQDWNTWLLIAPFTEFASLPVSTVTIGTETASLTRPKNIHVLEERWVKQKDCCKYVCEKLPEYYKQPAIEKEYDDYVNTVCMDYSYEKIDYRSAKRHALLLSDNSLRIRCAKSWLMFYPYAIVGKLRHIFQQK